MPNFREVYDDMMTNNNSSDESSSDAEGNGFVEDLHATKRQISGGGRGARVKSPKRKSPAKKKARKSKSPAKKKARTSKSPAKKKARTSGSKSGIPKYPTAKSRAGRYRAVFEGRAQMTGQGGLIKSQLTKNSSGKIVSKAKSKKAPNDYIAMSNKAKAEGLDSFFYTGKDGIEKEYFRQTKDHLIFYKAM